MKPFVLVTGDFVTTGGMDRANYALAMHLARRGHPVHLVTHRAASDLLALPNVRVHRVPKFAGSYFLGGLLLDHVGRFWARRLARERGRVVVNGGNCLFGDVNWVHYVHAAYRAGGQAGFSRHVKQTITHRAFCRAEARALRRAGLILANSEATRSELVSRLGLAPARIEVVYYGIDPLRFRPLPPAEQTARRGRLGWPTDRPLVVFIGALGDRRKGFDTLFDAWQFLCTDSGWDANLVVIGSGAELPIWIERAKALGLATRIHFMGFRVDVPDLLPCCDLLVAPTRYEAYGLGVHEALCCGLPALVSRCAGVAERYPAVLQDLLIDGSDGAPTLARQLQGWRSQAGKYRAAMEPVTSDLRKYTWDDMAERIVKLIEG